MPLASRERRPYKASVCASHGPCQLRATRPAPPCFADEGQKQIPRAGENHRPRNDAGAKSQAFGGKFDRPWNIFRTAEMPREENEITKSPHKIVRAIARTVSDPTA